MINDESIPFYWKRHEGFHQYYRWIEALYPLQLAFHLLYSLTRSSPMEELSKYYAQIKNHTLIKVRITQYSHQHMINPKYLAIIIGAIVLQSNCLSFPLDADEPNNTMIFQTNGKYTFYVISSGKEKHDVDCIIEVAGKVVYNNTGNDLQFTYDYGNDYVTINISSTDGGERNISFDFYPENDPLIHVIDKRDVKYIEGVLVNVHKSLQTISRNQQFHIQRDSSHKNTLEQSESHIKWAGVIKIAFLLSSALIQLWIMKGFFKGNAQPYQPVST